jgi:outer membrane protein
MKKVLIFTIAILSLTAFSKTKIGVLNIEKIFLGLNDGKAILATMKKAHAGKQKKLNSLKEELTKEQEAIQKSSMVLSEKAKGKKMRAMQAKVMKAQELAMKFQREMQKMELNLKSPILKKIEPIIKDISEKKGVDFTVESNQTRILYAAEKIDLSEDIIKAYNKKYKK